MVKRTLVFLIAAVIGIIGLEVGERLFHQDFAPTVQAIIGRPLTPVSVAGVARRTSRRCAVGVYDC
jgi:hypothetical protein